MLVGTDINPLESQPNDIHPREVIKQDYVAYLDAFWDGEGETGIYLAMQEKRGW